MKIYVNEKQMKVTEGSSVFEVRDFVKKSANVYIINGMPITEDRKLKENDRLTLITKKEIPTEEELEALLVARHTPGVHEKIKKACVGIAGLGGLGSNVAISLARLGIGKLILVDYDVVEPSNLNRQQYFIKHIGLKKTEALKSLIKEINPFVDIEIKDTYLNDKNIENTFKATNIVVEALDNAESKANLVNTLLVKCPDKVVVAASGMAGYFSNNTIKTRKVRNNLFLVGDAVSEVREGCGLMAPRVAIAANHQSNMVLRLILGETEI